MLVDKYKVKLAEKLENVANKAQRIMQEEASKSVATTPVIRTGALEKSIFKEKRAENEYAVGTRIPYARYVLFGRGEVKPKERKALYWESKNGKVFSQYARPTKPHNFIEDTAKRLRGEQ